MNIIRVLVDPSSSGFPRTICSTNFDFRKIVLNHDAASAGTPTNLKYPRSSAPRDPANLAQARSLPPRLSGLLTTLVEHQHHHQVHHDPSFFFITSRSGALRLISNYSRLRPDQIENAIGFFDTYRFHSRYVSTQLTAQRLLTAELMNKLVTKQKGE
jgi:hypothetical protein